MKHSPNYKKIYADMIAAKHPDKLGICKSILDKNIMTILDIIELNQLISGKVTPETETQNQKLKSYDKTAIFEILDYQTKYKLNNIQLARHFKLSRNTITKWRRIFFSSFSS